MNIWRSGELPPRGSRFVALFADGGGATVFYRPLCGGLIDAKGEELVGMDESVADWLLEAGYLSWVELPERSACWKTFVDPLPGVGVPFIALITLRGNQREAHGYVILPDVSDNGTFYLTDSDGWWDIEFDQNQSAADYLIERGYEYWTPYPDGVQIWCVHGGGE